MVGVQTAHFGWSIGVDWSGLEGAGVEWSEFWWANSQFAPIGLQPLHWTPVGLQLEKWGTVKYSCADELVAPVSSILGQECCPLDHERELPGLAVFILTLPLPLVGLCVLAFRVPWVARRESPVREGDRGLISVAISGPIFFTSSNNSSSWRTYELSAKGCRLPPCSS